MREKQIKRELVYIIIYNRENVTEDEIESKKRESGNN